jgi:hypothetical protein
VLRRHCHTSLVHAGYASHSSSSSSNSSSNSNTASLQLDARTAAARVTQWLAALLPKLHTQCSTALRSVRSAAALAAVREELWRVTHTFNHLQFDTITTATTTATATAAVSADTTAVSGNSSSVSSSAADSTGAAVWSAACAALVDTAVLDRGLKAAGMQTLLTQRRRSSLSTLTSNSSSSSQQQQQQQPPLDLWSVLFTRYATGSTTTYNSTQLYI